MANERKHHLSLFTLLMVILAVVFVLSMCYGAVNIKIDEIISGLDKWIHGRDDMSLNERIFISIRLPRALLCIIVGAGLAVGGVLMQALFRNPIVEPGLVGTSSGAAFGAALYFVLGTVLKFNAGEWTLPIAASVGGILSTTLVFMLARTKTTGKSSIVALLLTGIAVNALFMSGVGFLSYIARDPQARSITFWNLGTLSGAGWHPVIITSIMTIACVFVALKYAKHLNALMIGDEEAEYLGVNTRKLKFNVLLINVLMIAVSTAFTGVISFVGLIIPHLLRIIWGSDNRFLISHGVLAGAILLSLADLTARMVLRPAELPIGIVTSLIGVPVFIILLRRKQYFF